MVFLWCLSLTVLGCSKKSLTLAPVTNVGMKVTTSPLETAEKAFDSNYAVFCSTGDCPSYVGALVFQVKSWLEIAGQEEKSPLGFCSVTLIGPKLIVTSTHCIPEQMQVEGTSCTDRMDIRFPELKELGLPAEKLICDKIEKFSAIPLSGKSKMNIEWAVISLKESSARTPAHTVQKSISLGTEIHGYPVFYNPLFPMGEIQKVNCKVSELGYLLPQTFHAESALFYANECSTPLIQGNSGTSFFDDSESLVALLSATVHQKFQSAIEAGVDGSPLIVGTKARCISVFGRTPESCTLSPEDDGFAYATVMTSTLRAFNEGVVKNNIDTLKPSPSKYIGWVPANEANVNSIFVDLYGDENYTNSHNYFLTKNFPELARDMRDEVVEILGQVPVCIKKEKLSGKSIVEDIMEYTVFNFWDFELYPDENNQMYFRTLKNMRLEVGAQRIKIPVVITKLPGLVSDNYRVEYQHKIDPFVLTSNEKSLVEGFCTKELAAKIAACGADNQCKGNEETSTPTVRCQHVYKKMGFSHYLKGFSFDVPSC
jgi:hypothetical protein